MSSLDLLSHSRPRFVPPSDTDINDAFEDEDVDVDGSGGAEIPSIRHFLRNNPYAEGASNMNDKNLQYERRVTKVVEDVQNVAIEWKDISLSSSGSCFGRGKKALLDNISGYALPGELMAVMGPSGAGKSTLLNVLSGRVSEGVTGSIKIGGIPSSKRNAIASKYGAGVTALVAQNDAVHSELTVKEIIRYSAWLRLPSSTSLSEKGKRVNETISALNLDHVKHSQVGEPPHQVLSGGEKRRVTVGIEVIQKPSILFLDEPTSGLDSESALSIVKLLYEFAKVGRRAVVMTIHQPSERMFDLFDTVLFIAGGKTMYFGPRSEVRSFYENQGFPFPLNTPTPEFVMSIISYYQEHKSLETLHKTFMDSPYSSQQSILPATAATLGISINEDVPEEGNKIRRAAKWTYNTITSNDKYATSFLEQLFFLSHRNFINILRLKEIFIARIFIMLILAAAVGTMYLQLDEDEEEKIGAFLILTIAIIYFNTLETLPAYVKERIIFMREYSSGTFRLSAYATSSFLVHLPFLAVLTACYCIPAYWLVGLNTKYYCFGYFCMVIMVCFIGGQSIIMIVAVLTPDAQIGNSISTALMSLLFFFSGYFLKPDEIPGWWVWFHYLSSFKYALEGLLINQFDYRITCEYFVPPGYVVNEPCYKTSHEILFDDFQISIGDKWLNLLILFAFSMFFRVVAYSLLWVTHKYKIHGRN